MPIASLLRGLAVQPIVALVIASSVASGCSDTGGGNHASPDLSSSNRDGGTGAWTDTPYLSTTASHTFSAPEPATEAGVDYGARIVTDVGTILVDLTETQTPLTVNSFVFLARNHFFEGILFHRVIEDFMAQAGDPNTIDGAPSTWGYGGPGYEFANEIDPALTFAEGGVLAMANAGADTNGSQFFITFGEASFLDGKYSVFGRALEGQSVLAAIKRGEPPSMPTRITSVQIVQR